MRCKNEKWRKTLKKTLKNDVKKSVKNMQDFHTSEDIENEIKTVSSSDNFQDQEKDFSHQKSVKKVRGELVASEGMEHTPFLWTIKIITLNNCYLRQELSFVGCLFIPHL